MKEDVKSKPRIRSSERKNKLRTEDRTGISIDHLCQTIKKMFKETEVLYRHLNESSKLPFME